jgi:frataxin-like iron-binding protein CyaY
MTFLDAAEGLGEEICTELETYGRARIPLESSAISALTYLRDRTLTIEFTDGSRYAISDFPALELSRWLTASSAGAYFNANVRGRY